MDPKEREQVELDDDGDGIDETRFGDLTDDWGPPEGREETDG